MFLEYNNSIVLPCTVDAGKFRYLFFITLDNKIRVHDLDLVHQLLIFSEYHKKQGEFRIYLCVSGRHCHPESEGLWLPLSSRGSECPGFCFSTSLCCSDFFSVCLSKLFSTHFPITLMGYSAYILWISLLLMLTRVGFYILQPNMRINIRDNKSSV